MKIRPAAAGSVASQYNASFSQSLVYVGPRLGLRRRDNFNGHGEFDFPCAKRTCHSTCGILGESGENEFLGCRDCGDFRIVAWSNNNVLGCTMVGTTLSDPVHPLRPIFLGDRSKASSG